MAFIKICEGCGKEFTPQPDRLGRINKKKRHCTQSCWVRRYNREDREHSVKGAQAAGEAAKKQRGTIRGSGKAYIKEDQRHQHRVVAERVLGRDLISGEVVHHEDRNHKNNDPHNLIVFNSQGDHFRHHLTCMKKQIECTCICIRLTNLIGGDA